MHILDWDCGKINVNKASHNSYVVEISVDLEPHFPAVAATAVRLFMAYNE